MATIEKSESRKEAAEAQPIASGELLFRPVIDDIHIK